MMLSILSKCRRLASRQYDIKTYTAQMKAPSYGLALARSFATTRSIAGQDLEASRPIPATRIAQEGSNQLSLETPRNGVEYALTTLDKVKSKSS